MKQYKIDATFMWRGRTFARISTDYFSIFCMVMVVTFAVFMLAGIMQIGIAIINRS